MAAGTNQSAAYRDARGHVGRVRFFVDTGHTLTQQAVQAEHVITDIQSLSNAALQTATGPYAPPASAVVYGTDGEFPDAEDKAVMTFSTPTGALHRIEIPAPQSVIFEADGETVDVTVEEVQQFIADVSDDTFMGTAPAAGLGGPLVSRDGAQLTLWIGGLRARRKFQRKITIYSKTPSETGPDE